MSRLYSPLIRTCIDLPCMVSCSKLRRVHSSTHYHFTDQRLGVPVITRSQDHKTYTERKAHVGLWNSHRSSLCISVSGPKIKLVLCKVSLKSTPCISAGSYRLINSWQKTLKGLSESPGCPHLLSPDWGDGGRGHNAHFSLTDLQRMFQNLGGSGHR